VNGYFVGVIVYYVKKITSAIAESANSCFMRYQASELLSTLWVRSKEPTNFLFFINGVVMKLAECSEAKRSKVEERRIADKLFHYEGICFHCVSPLIFVD